MTAELGLKRKSLVANATIHKPHLDGIKCNSQNNTRSSQAQATRHRRQHDVPLYYPALGTKQPEVGASTASAGPPLAAGTDFVSPAPEP